MSNRNFILIVITVTNIDIEILCEMIKTKNDLIVYAIVYVLN